MMKRHACPQYEQPCSSREAMTPALGWGLGLQGLEQPGKEHPDLALPTPALQAGTHLDQTPAVHIDHFNHDCGRLDSALLPDGLLAGLVPPRMRQLAALCSARSG